MRAMENVVDTVVRLLASNMRVVKADGSIANVCVSREWFDHELLRDYDGQVTVGLSETRDTKVELSCKIRRSISNLRVNVWAADRLMRNKIVDEINCIVRQNRSKPNETLYHFASVGQASGTHKAYYAAASMELAPDDDGWVELVDADYAKIWYSDDERFYRQCTVNGEFAMMLFGFKIESQANVLQKMILSFEGYGIAPSGYGVTVKVWNCMAQEWQNAAAGIGENDETITISVVSELQDYVDEAGRVWLLARTTNPSDGVSPAIIYCDYAFCTVTVNGISYLDVVSFRDMDHVDVKPFIFHTEFALKSWSFENVGV